MLKKSEASHARLDVASRHEKAAKIITALSLYTDLTKAKVLDIGTGAGVIAADIAARAKAVESVDMSDERQVREGYRFTKVTGESLPFGDAEFDVVVYNHAVEHVPDQQKHLNEIARVLKPGGIVYLATPNKFGLMDPHYKLPLVSWLPRPLAAQYLRLTKHKNWDIYPVSPWTLRRLAAGSFSGENLTADIIKHPRKYDMPVSLPVKLLGVLPLPVLRLLAPFVPSQIHLLKRLP